MRKGGEEVLVTGDLNARTSDLEDFIIEDDFKCIPGEEW